VSRTVVIALDRSDLSARALPFAQQVAQLWRGRLVLVHALVSQNEVAAVPVELELRSIVQDLTALGITAEAVIRRNSPAQAIADVVREREADLVVMASHQRHGLNRWLRGSITEDVLARTGAPLVMIPGEGAPVLGPRRRILVPLDGSPTAEAGLDFLRGRSTNGPHRAAAPSSRCAHAFHSRGGSDVERGGIDSSRVGCGSPGSSRIPVQTHRHNS
jgi:nucleotide-binding universal stress UspA family protein